MEVAARGMPPSVMKGSVASPSFGYLSPPGPTKFCPAMDPADVISPLSHTAHNMWQNVVPSHVPTHKCGDEVAGIVPALVVAVRRFNSGRARGGTVALVV